MNSDAGWIVILVALLGVAAWKLWPEFQLQGDEQQGWANALSLPTDSGMNLADQIPYEQVNWGNQNQFLVTQDVPGANLSDYAQGGD